MIVPTSAALDESTYAWSQPSRRLVELSEDELLAEYDMVLTDAGYSQRSRAGFVEEALAYDAGMLCFESTLTLTNMGGGLSHADARWRQEAQVFFALARLREPQ